MGYPAAGRREDIRALFERCNLLKSIYENYLNAKDEVIFAVVDARVKNIAETYLLQHQSQKLAFDHLLKLVISSIQNEESFPSKELACFTGALQTLVSQCMAKEEDQIIPSLIQKLSLEEQASLVWKFLCSIPTNVVAKFIPWRSFSNRSFSPGWKGKITVLARQRRRRFLSGAFSNHDLLAFCDRLQFIAEICMFHSIAEDKVIYPAVYGQIPIFQDHKNEESLSNEFRCLIEWHFHDEEVKVLPLVRKHLSIKRQQELLHQSLCVMPLKLIEHVLPWLVKSLTANEAKNFVSNMKLAAPASDIALVQLFCDWASKDSIDCLYSSRSLHFNSIVPSHSVWETYNSFSDTGIAEQPIAVVFKVHKAIRRDLEYLDNKSERLSDCDEMFLQQFIEMFCLLRRLYRVHSNAEDYILSTRSGAPIAECVGKYSELATRLRVMFMSLRMIVDQHMYQEEIELWPLFGVHFSVEEQNKMVGFILGTTGAEVLRSMLPWVTSALTEDEQSKMLDTFKNVTKNTMFKDWLSECWKGTSLSTAQPNLETSISVKASQRQIDRTFNCHRRNNLKHQMTSYWISAQRSLPIAIAVDSSDGEHLGGRFCHDIMSDHTMDRKATSEMMCMCCLNIQPIGPVCLTASCNEFPMAKYYCSTCNVFDDRNVYHCPFCNLCRVGKGLGIDYFHCMSCNCCLGMASMNHKCRREMSGN
ncbi:hypothetical protein M0R45_035841 [Rubus argutus]|uniref:Uncharacterized protein n=1 Tax=Rubus argutus TaxID=59490 RepID=A0AAW1VUB1_RUBAR